MLWKGFQKPKRLEVNRETLTSSYGQFWAQPFERGFGTTIGNALRRALLSSIEGAAITAVKIEGVLHEFSSLPGVVEDTTDIILNLKRINFKLNGPGPKTLHLKKSGEGVATARDLEVDADVEIVNPDQPIATLADGGTLLMEMRLKNGRGYVPADRNFDSILPVGYIPVDSVHSPVRKVNYYVEDARLGQTTDYDKLVLEVWTNGTILPQTSVAMGAKLIRDHLNIFINFEEEEEVEEGARDEQASLNENLNRSVEELELSVRTYNCLKNANIRNIADLVEKSEAEMLTIKNLGRRSLDEVKEILASMNLTLGMKVDRSKAAPPAADAAGGE
jgi:DNA-directed RNA polymerase subunit alpha